MATYKLSIARIRGCPAPKRIAAAMEAFGLPEADEFGVLQHSATDQAVRATVVRRTQAAIPRLDSDNRQVTAQAVERVAAYPFAIVPSREVLEVYAGSATAVEQVGAFLSGSLGLPVTVELSELDIPEALRRLSQEAPKFHLVAVRVKDYAHNSYMAGPYAPKFLDSVHGMEFLEEYGQSVTQARVRFQGKTGRATVTLSARTCFSYSCADDDMPDVQALLRRLA